MKRGCQVGSVGVKWEWGELCCLDLLVFECWTIATDDSRLSSLCLFQIGHEAPPTQNIQLRNPSDVDIEYRIDTSPLVTVMMTT